MYRNTKYFMALQVVDNELPYVLVYSSLSWCYSVFSYLPRHLRGLEL